MSDEAAFGVLGIGIVGHWMDDTLFVLVAFGPFQ